MPRLKVLAMGLRTTDHSFSKGAVYFALDQMSARPDARELMERFARALNDKASSGFPDLEVTFDQYLFAPLQMEAARTSASMTYLREYWFDANSAKSYFPDYQPIAPICGMGLLKTIEESLKGQPDPLPIDSWWLMDHQRFEVITLVSKQQVTMLVATPRPSGPTPTAIWSAAAEGYTTGRLGVVTRKFER
jgi:hypothetical protein